MLMQKVLQPTEMKSYVSLTETIQGKLYKFLLLLLVTGSIGGCGLLSGPANKLVEALCYKPEGRRFESLLGGFFQLT
jgi:hypothetical protein